MKRLLIALMLLAVASPASAALTKSTAIDVIDAWQLVAEGTMVTGEPCSVSDSYESVLYIEVAPAEAGETTGSYVYVEVSYGDDDWTLLTGQPFKSTAATPGVSDVNEAITDANTVVDLTDAVAGNFDVPGRKWFIVEAVTANSETVRTKSHASDACTLASAVKNSHADTTVVIDLVDEWVVKIPMAVAYVRTSVYNTDTGQDAAFTTRISKVTALN